MIWARESHSAMQDICPCRSEFILETIKHVGVSYYFLIRMAKLVQIIPHGRHNPIHTTPWC